MSELTNDERILIGREFEKLSEPVTVQLTVPKGESDQIKELRSMLEQIAAMDERIHLDVETDEGDRDDEDDAPMLPCITLLDSSGSGKGVFFYGTPSINALPAFAEAISLVSSGVSDLEEAIIERAKALGDMKLEVLYTPNTPGATQAISIGNRLALATGKMTCSSIELIEFPEIAERYKVLGVPKTIADRSLRFTGSYPLEEVMGILEKRISDVED